MGKRRLAHLMRTNQVSKNKRTNKSGQSDEDRFKKAQEMARQHGLGGQPQPANLTADEDPQDVEWVDMDLIEQLNQHTTPPPPPDPPLPPPKPHPGLQYASRRKSFHLQWAALEKEVASHFLVFQQQTGNWTTQHSYLGSKVPGCSCVPETNPCKIDLIDILCKYFKSHLCFITTQLKLTIQTFLSISTRSPQLVHHKLLQLQTRSYTVTIPRLPPNFSSEGSDGFFHPPSSTSPFPLAHKCSTQTGFCHRSSLIPEHPYQQPHNLAWFRRDSSFPLRPFLRHR